MAALSRNHEGPTELEERPSKRPRVDGEDGGVDDLSTRTETAEDEDHDESRDEQAFRDSSDPSRSSDLYLDTVCPQLSR